MTSLSQLFVGVLAAGRAKDKSGSFVGKMFARGATFCSREAPFITAPI
jgi:hypothetical protein